MLLGFFKQFLAVFCSKQYERRQQVLVHIQDFLNTAIHKYRSDQRLEHIT